MPEIPVKQNHELAKSCFEQDFRKVEQLNSELDYGWILSPFFSDLQLYIDIWAKDENGAKLDDFHLKFDMSYYRKWPPGVTYINPETKTFNGGSDLRWLPKLVIKPPSVDIAYHPSYKLTNGETKQLVCNSMTLEYYLSNHNPNPDQKWDPSVNNFGTTLLTLDIMLRKPYYGGRSS